MTAARVRRIRAWAGLLGPVSFVATWLVLGSWRRGYSPVHEPVSRLAAVGAPTRRAMSAGFVVLAAGIGAYAPLLSDEHPGRAVAAARTTALATVGLAALPLGAARGDRPHVAAAAATYVSLAATPFLAGAPRRGALVGAALAASAVLPRCAGLAQRVGLTAGHLWIAGSAARALRGRGN